MLLQFPSEAAFKNDNSEWHFGLAASSFNLDEEYQYIPMIKEVVHAYAYAQNDLTYNHVWKRFPQLPEISSMLLRELFAYVKRTVEEEFQRSVRGVVVVLPDDVLLVKPDLRQDIVAAWRENGVNEVTDITDISAAILAYIIKTPHEELLTKITERSCYLIVCNAGHDDFSVNVFEVIDNNHMERCSSGLGILRHRLGDARKQITKTVEKKMETAGMAEIPNEMMAEFNKECEHQMEQFYSQMTGKVTFRTLMHSRLTPAITRDEYNEIIMPIVEDVVGCVETELNRFGLTEKDDKTGKTYITQGVEALLVGKNARLLPLRDQLEELFRKTFSVRLASYADRAEAIGAAVGSYLFGIVERSEQIDKYFHIAANDQVDLQEIFRMLFPQNESLRPQIAATKGVCVTERPSVTLHGELHVGKREHGISVSDFTLTLYTKPIKASLLHCIKLEHCQNGVSTVQMYYDMALGKRLKITWEHPTGEQPYLEITQFIQQDGFRGRGSLRFLCNEVEECHDFIQAYDLRQTEMVTAFPSADEEFGTMANYYAFVVLVSPQLAISFKGPPTIFVPSILLARPENAEDPPFVVQGQNIDNRGQICEGPFILRPKSSYDPVQRSQDSSDTAVIETSMDTGYHICFPNAEILQWFREQVYGYV
ncbi:uncharacterized protein LOC129598454 isoform X2 [Paramacrobiotus metropolitanus]|nr:uncharacterized protein LOC129598454 isoform X2 [Paramacrobiotus metropolitanus]